MSICQARIGTPRRIAVLRALQLGDLLCVVPALRALRAAAPQAEIVLIGLPWARAFVQRFSHYLDGFLEFPGYPGLPERSLAAIQSIPHFFTTAQSQGFDLALQMHGSGTITNPVTLLLGARVNAGFFRPGEFCPDPDYFLPYPTHSHEVRRHLQLMTFLGIPARGEGLEFPLLSSDWQELQALGLGLRPGSYVCVHPGARSQFRRWSVSQFAVVADRLAQQGLTVVLTGTAQERELTQALAAQMQATPIDLAGRTSLGAMAALLSQARLLVCNDTSVSHVAAGLQVPSVVIFTGSDPAQWAPLDRQHHRAVQTVVGQGTEAVIAQAQSLLQREFQPERRDVA